MAHYVFGYGSLLEYESRSGTEPSAAGLYPAKVKGYQRGWFHRFDTPSLTTSFLGVVPEDDQVINGMIYRVDQIDETDKRERGYTRQAIHKDQLEWYDPANFKLNFSDDDRLYIYVTDPECYRIVDAKNPIIQSYIDICLNGCFQADYALGNLAAQPPSPTIAQFNRVELKGIFDSSRYQVAPEDIETSRFALDFVETTQYWSEHWVNDRIHARRPFAIKNAWRIDELLYAKLPDYFRHIRIESV